MNDELVARLRDYRPCLQPDLCICDRHTVDEAAAEIERLTTQLAEARESERAAVVAWLRGLHWTHAHNQEALFFAAAIEDKVHLT